MYKHDARAGGGRKDMDMQENMRSIWAKISQKQSLEDAARRLTGTCVPLALKLSLSAILGLGISMWPAAGAARMVLCLL